MQEIFSIPLVAVLERRVGRQADSMPASTELMILLDTSLPMFNPSDLKQHTPLVCLRLRLRAGLSDKFDLQVVRSAARTVATRAPLSLKTSVPAILLILVVSLADLLPQIAQAALPTRSLIVFAAVARCLRWQVYPTWEASRSLTTRVKMMPSMMI